MMASMGSLFRKKKMDRTDSEEKSFEMSSNELWAKLDEGGVDGSSSVLQKPSTKYEIYEKQV